MGLPAPLVDDDGDALEEEPVADATGPVPVGPPIGAVDWPLISAWIVELKEPVMLVILLRENINVDPSKQQGGKDARELGGKGFFIVLSCVGVLEGLRSSPDEAKSWLRIERKKKT